MELIVKHFSELSAEELFEIYKLRISVFVVEQNCPYQEADDADRAAYHVWLKDETGIKAYARVLPPGVTFDSAAIGRVIAVKRRCGLGSKIVAAAVNIAKEKFGADKITIEAQTYARRLYEKSRFSPNIGRISGRWYSAYPDAADAVDFICNRIPQNLRVPDTQPAHGGFCILVRRRA